jgi:hypothetical protein
MSYVSKFGGLGITTGQGITTGIDSAGVIAGTLVGGPVGAAVSTGVALVTSLLQGVINGCGSTCEVTSTWANQIEAALQQNITAYFALPTPRSTTDQAAAIANFNAGWNALVSQCNQASLGQAGQDCITDREAGACHYTQPASSVPPWGSPPAGACWNWFSGYLYPIQDDEDVVTPAAGTPSTALSTATESLPGGTTEVGGMSLGTIGLLAAAAFAAWMVLK